MYIKYVQYLSSVHGKRTFIKPCKTSEVNAWKHCKMKWSQESFSPSFKIQSAGGDLGAAEGVDFICVYERKLMGRVLN